MPKVRKSDFGIIKVILLFNLLHSLVLLGHNAYLKHKGYLFNIMEWGDFIFFQFFVDFIFSSIFFIVISEIVEKFIRNGARRIYVVLFHTVMISLFTILIKVPNELLYLWTSGKEISINQEYLNVVFSGVLVYVHRDFLLYLSMIFIIHLLNYHKKEEEQNKKEGEMRELLIATELKQLQSSINPHFLFNALNAISTLIRESNHRAKNAIADLGVLLNDILNDDSSNYNTIEQEIELIDKYLKIIMLRYGNSIRFTKKISQVSKNILIPRFIIQPLIENAIKHGFHDREQLNLYLEINQSNNVEIIVSNDGIPFNFSKMVDNRGLGLSNVKKRLALLFPDRHDFSINNTNNMVRITLRFPILKNDSTTGT
ncbi:sensor histidine kinase [Flagellimonas nanhaiensis]|uniref:Signal transduction histidine kinase internal region domain-containing protein n=1 Tax=Flagellimonas nanhaiensis TaxID=2292706 RepID=A0A371JLM3_9FLAO|nr:histidine kinase [Allomuricauda nanhaiensis]RDY57903.1 hypothetical protein DX873_17300 [Allomuricauda nanhaiensis]